MPLVSKPTDHQQRCVQEIEEREREGLSCVLFSACGSGKTLIGLMLADRDRQRRERESARSIAASSSSSASESHHSHATLVVAPKSAVASWLEQAATHFRPKLAARLYRQTAGTRTHLSAWCVLSSMQLLVTDYDSVAAESAAPSGKLFQRRWHRVVFDEAHVLRNRKTRLHAACSALRSRHRLLMTATPINNSERDMHALHALCLEPEQLSDFDLARPNQQQDAIKRFCERNVVYLGAAPQAPSAPRSTEVFFEVADRFSSEAERSAYAHAAGDVPELLLEDEDENGADPLAKLGAALRACSAMTDRARGTHNTKMRMVLRYMRCVAERRESAVIFVRFRRSLVDVSAALERLRSATGRRVSWVGTISGDTSAKERDRLVAQFRGRCGASRNRTCSALVCTLGTLNQGVNLQCARHVLLAYAWWNPVADYQSRSRVQRTGQRHPLSYAAKFMVRDSVEEQVWEMCKRKSRSGARLEGSLDAPTRASSSSSSSSSSSIYCNLYPEASFRTSSGCLEQLFGLLERCTQREQKPHSVKRAH